MKENVVALKVTMNYVFSMEIAITQIRYSRMLCYTYQYLLHALGCLARRFNES